MVITKVFPLVIKESKDDKKLKMQKKMNIIARKGLQHKIGGRRDTGNAQLMAEKYKSGVFWKSTKTDVDSPREEQLGK